VVVAKRRTRKSPKAAALVAALQRELRKAIRSTVARAKRDLAGQTIYGVALAIHGSGTVSGMAFGTEEGLEATVDQYLEAGWKSRKGNSRAALRDMLRRKKEGRREPSPGFLLPGLLGASGARASRGAIR
jgi:hypothetical protein